MGALSENKSYNVFNKITFSFLNTLLIIIFLP